MAVASRQRALCTGNSLAFQNRKSHTVGVWCNRKGIHWPTSGVTATSRNASEVSRISDVRWRCYSVKLFSLSITSQLLKSPKVVEAVKGNNCLLWSSDCNPGIEFSIPASGIEKFVIPGSQDFVSRLGLQIDRHFSIHSWLLAFKRNFFRYSITARKK